MQSRIKYLDVAKFIGIFCIYLGHFGTSAGNAYNFVFAFHVPLFFFLSGCTENLSTQIPLHNYIVKTMKGTLFPCYLFAIASVVVQSIFDNTHSGIASNMMHIFRGCIRNHFFAGSLWFLSCLFVVKIVFYILRKLLKYNLAVLAVCLSLYCVAELVISPRPFVEPHMPYNVDSACYYSVFYALGYCCFGMIQSLLNWDSLHKRIICTVAGVISFVYAAVLFFGKNLLYYFYNNTVAVLVNSILGPVLIIFLVLVVSQLLENVKLFAEIGRDTLFLCGSEHIVKLVIPICFQIVGLSIQLPNPLAVYIYTFALLVVCTKALVPVEKALFRKLRLLQ